LARRINLVAAIQEELPVLNSLFVTFTTIVYLAAQAMVVLMILSFNWVQRAGKGAVRWGTSARDVEHVVPRSVNSATTHAPQTKPWWRRVTSIDPKNQRPR
jgi:hypothetical protein